MEFGAQRKFSVASEFQSPLTNHVQGCMVEDWSHKSHNNQEAEKVGSWDHGAGVGSDFSMLWSEDSGAVLEGRGVSKVRLEEQDKQAKVARIAFQLSQG